jgi:hypothetical protein
MSHIPEDAGLASEPVFGVGGEENPSTQEV